MNKLFLPALALSLAASLLTLAPRRVVGVVAG